MSKSIRIKFMSYDHKVLDKFVREIIRTINKSGVAVIGAIPLPTVLDRYVVNNSHHIFKKSKFIMHRATHSRLIVIENPTSELMSILNDVPADPMVHNKLFVKDK